MLKIMTGAIAAAALTASPVFAAPTAPVANPAASLSVASSVRAASPARHDSKLAAPGGIIALVLAAAVVAGAVIIIVDDDDSDSN